MVKIYTSIFFLLLFQSLQAQIYVDSTATIGSNGGSSWNDAYTDLQDALMTATAGDSIFVSKGTYYPDGGGGTKSLSFVLPDSVVVMGGFNTQNGDLTLSDRDWETNPTILSGDIGTPNDSTDNSLNVVRTYGVSSVALLDGFTVTGGNRTGSTIGGAGIRNENGSMVRIFNVIIRDNAAIAIGGGMENFGSSPTIFNATFINNTAGNSGGAMYNNNGGTPSITNCTFIANSALIGGGIINLNNSNAIIINSIFRGNLATGDGGAMRNLNSSPEIFNCTFSGNNADRGGAIYNSSNSAPAFFNSIIWNNSADADINTTSSSVFNSQSIPTFSYSLVDNSGGSGSWESTVGTDNGNNKDLNPQFLTPLDPLNAPTTEGNLRLKPSSPAINMGNNMAYNVASGPAIDLDSADRILQTQIDLGAYEQLDCAGLGAISIIYVDSAATGTGTGLTWTDAFNDLQNALQYPCPIDSIYVSQGTYFPDGGTANRDTFFVIPDGVVVLGGFSTADGATTLTDRDWDAYPTILSGEIGDTTNLTDNSFHVVSLNNTSSDSEVDGFFITRGYANGSSAGLRNRGGGIISSGGDAMIRNCTIEDNFSGSFGGGLYMGLGSASTIQNCHFRNNVCNNDGGGAIGIDNTTLPTFVNTLFSGNQTLNSNGGAVYVFGSNAGASFTNSTFTGNAASQDGGAIGVGNAMVVVNNCIIWNNSANNDATSPSASLWNFSTTTGGITIMNSIVENSGSSSSWGMPATINDGGENKDLDPLFILPINPTSAPSAAGEFQLKDASLAINMGDNTHYPGTSPSYDLAEMPRFFNTTIDMGAYENTCSGILTNLYVDVTNAPGGNGLSWATAFSDLQDALNYTGCTADTIFVSAGTYFPDGSNNGGGTGSRDTSFFLNESTVVLGGFNTATNDTTLADRDWKTFETILSGNIGNTGTNGDNTYHVVVAIDVTSTTVLDGFTIRDGNANISSGDLRRGGGIFARNGDAMFRNMTITDNFSQFEGGGIYLNSSSPAFENIIVQNNQTGASGGGGFYIAGKNDTTNLVNTLISGNRTQKRGGGIYLFRSNLRVYNNTFSANIAVDQDGGAIYNYEGNLEVYNSILWKNEAQSGTDYDGASIFNANTATAFVANSIIANSDGSGVGWDGDIGTDGGGNKDMDPLFLMEIDPATAPTDAGNFSLHLISSAIDMGDSTFYAVSFPAFDLACDDRIQREQIDMGAYEVFGCTDAVVIYVDSAATGVNTGLSWTNAFINLQDALNYICDYDTIRVAKGTYYPDEGAEQTNDDVTATFNIPSDVVLLGGYDPGGSILRDWDTNPTILSGDLDQDGRLSGNARHVVTATNTSATTEINGFIVERGYAYARDGADGNRRGGGMFNNNSDTQLKNMIFRRNASSQFNRSGGGALFVQNGSDVYIENSLFYNNLAHSYGGAALISNSSLVAVNTVFRGNTASGPGGAIASVGMAQVDIRLVNVSISGNQATSNGSAIGLVTADSFIVQNSIIWNNRGDSSQLSVDTANTFLIENSIVEFSGGSSNWMLTQATDGGGNKDQDPIFVEPGSPSTTPNDVGDLKLQSNSPAINMGDSNFYADTFPAIDLACDDRIQQGQIDMGAYEVFGCTDVVVLYVDSAASGFNTGLTWTDAFVSLQDALTFSCDYDSIFVSKGTYYPDGGSGNQDSSFFIPDSVVVLGGFNTVTDDTTLSTRDWMVNTTILSGDIGTLGDSLDNSYHVVTSISTSPITALDGFFIEQGNADLPSNGNHRGAGISLTNSSMQLRYLVVRNNSAVQVGGGMRIEGGTPILENLIVTNNYAGSSGGGLSSVNTTDLSISFSTFTNNTAVVNGGGLNISGNNTLLENLVVSGNVANGGGGGMMIFQDKALVVNTLVSGNMAAVDGGGMYIVQASPTMINVTIASNKAGTRGGGVASYIFTASPPIPIFANSIFYGNEAPVDSAYSPANAGQAVFTYSAFDEPNCPQNSDCSGAGNKFSIDPLFISPQPASAAPTIDGDLRLQATSPVINMGDSSLYADTFWPIDLGNVDRIQQGQIDMGAYEIEGCVDDTLICRDVSVALDTNGMAVITPEMVIQPTDFDTVFNYTGDLQSLTIPAGVTSIYIEAAGAKGGRATSQAGPKSGGKGATIASVFEVNSGEELQIIVAGSGNDNEFAGGGGGASFVAFGMNGYSDFMASNIMLIAGGGGGGRVLRGGNGDAFIIQSNPEGLGGIGDAGGGSAIFDGNGQKGGMAAINGAQGGGGGGYGGGGGVFGSYLAGGGGGATGGDSRVSRRGYGGTSYIGGNNPVQLSEGNNDNGFVGIIYNYDPAESISIDTVNCNDIASAKEVIVTRTTCVGTLDSCISVVTVIDNIIPIVSAPADAIAYCDQGTDPGITGMAIGDGIDSCGLERVQYSDVVIDNVCIDTIIRIWEAVDFAGNISLPDTQYITVFDTVAPILICPSSVNLQCGNDIIYTATLEDTTGGNIEGGLSSRTFTLSGFNELQGTILNVETDLNFTGAMDIVYAELRSPNGTNRRIFDFEGNCGGSNMVATFSDTAVNSAMDFNIECNGNPTKGPGTYQPLQSFSDFNGEDPSGDWKLFVFVVNNGITLNNWTLRVTAGKVPTIVEGCSDASLSFTDDSTNLTGCGTGYITRTYTATDGCGNQNSCIQTITVFKPLPQISCPADTTIDCGTDTSIASLGLPYATGACKNEETIITSRKNQYPGQIATYGYGIIASGSSSDSLVRINVATGEQTIIANINPNVESLTGGEFINGEYYISVNDVLYTVDTITGALAAVLAVDDRFYALDQDPTTGILYGIGPPFGTLNLFKIDLIANTVTQIGVNNDIVQPVWLAIDPAGNAYVLDGVTNAIYRIDLTTGQTIELVVQVNDGVNPVDVNGTGDAEFVTTPEGTFIYGNLKTVPSFANNFGRYNLQTGEFTIIAPTQTYLAAFASPGPSVTDTCPVVQTIIRTFIAEDDCGGRNFCDQIIMVQDTTAPVFTSLENQVTLACIDDTSNLATLVMVEDCHLDTLYFTDEVEGSGSCNNIILRTYTAMDACGNRTDTMQTIFINDTIPPQPVNCPGISIINCESGDPLPIATPDYADNCTPPESIMVMTQIDTFGLETESVFDDTISVRFYATDQCGNVDSSCVQHFICACPTINCHSVINVGLGPECAIEITSNMILNRPLDPFLDQYCEITIQNEFGAVMPDNILTYADRGRTFTVTIRCKIPGCGTQECQTTVIVDNGPAPLNFISAWQSSSDGDELVNNTPTRVRLPQKAITGPNISEGKINVYCGNIPDPSEHVPMVTDPCSNKMYTPEVQPDWVMPISCDEESDTAEVIFRTWEAYDKEGNLSTLTDTIVVFRLPKLTPGALVGTSASLRPGAMAANEDSFYCELQPVSARGGQALKRYASWKQPVGLHDYELPYTKLRGVTYEIPATIIIAGLTNAAAQRPDVLDDYLNCVILRKADGTEVTIGDIVSGDYMDDLLANASQEQLTYGFLQALIELNEKPINVVLERVFNFHPYLLLQSGDWVLSEGGQFEKVDEEWFYNGNGNPENNGAGSPYWFSGGWPSIYGSGDCVSYCDVEAGPQGSWGGCIKIRVPELDILTGLLNTRCDTICLPTGLHCGITIKSDAIADWTQTGTAGSCPQTRGIDTWITQTCWATTRNYCDPTGTGPCEVWNDQILSDLIGQNTVSGIVKSYECTDKAVKIHISQWQTLYDTIGPVFDFCYPDTGFIVGCEGFQDDIAWIWDHVKIQEAIREGRQYGAARAWESCNPTTYRVGTHDCIAEIYVPAVKVVDNCSGVNSVKAMIDIAGGTRAVALERTATETRILANGDTCYIYTYAHTADPIMVPFSGCNGELTQVRYEAADNCWNQSKWNKWIKIIDDVPPTVVMDRAVTIPLQNKIAWAHADTFDEGSWDNCTIDLRLARRADWWADTACVNLCDGTEPHAPYDNWVDLLDDLGVDRTQATTAVGGGTVGESSFNSKYKVEDLKTVLNKGEVEEYYYNQIVWLWEDAELCGQKVVHGWLYAIAANIAENCSATDEHGNVLKVKDLEEIFDHLTGTPGYGKEMALLGGGWSKSVPFKCEDACPSTHSTSSGTEGVTVELIVFDYCCNWGKGWSTVHVEDKGNARLVKRLPNLELTCEAYNSFYKDIVENAAALGENGSVSDSTGAFAALDGALEHYVKTWVDNQNRPTDIDGKLLGDSVLNFGYHSISCEEKSETVKVAVPNHDGTIDWVNQVTKTTYLDTTNHTGMNGIVGINCAASCVQDVWVDLDECGQGTITRRFHIKGGCGPTLRQAQGPPEWTEEQVIRVKSACGMRESMFNLPANLGSKTAPICLPQGLSAEYLPDTIGAVTLKAHLDGALCNSIAIGSEVKELDVVGNSGMKKYVITWTVIDWCAARTSSTRQFTYTQEVIATIDPACNVATDTDTTGDVSLITGHIMTELETAVKGVEVRAVLGQGSPIQVETPETGDFSLSINNGSQVSIIPGKNTGFSNGVSTADLIDIQRHVLQKKALDSKYKMIAADVNGNGRIEGLDVLELRKLVLNPSGVFANNTSWRFYDTKTDKEVYEINPLTEDQTINFTGVKIGDVNLSGDASRSSRSTTGNLRLNIADQTLKGGELYRMELRSDNFEDIRGLQYTLNYADAYVSVESIEGGVLNITQDNYLKYGPVSPAGALAQTGLLTFSWSEAEGVSVNADQVLFTIVLKVKSGVSLRDVLSLNNRVTQTEAYDADGGLKDVSLRFDGSRLKDGTEFALYQNTPNPYKGETVIGFKLPSATAATMTIYDVTGRMIKRIEGDFDAGYNEVRVRSEELGMTGVLYYQLDTDRYTATKKMIVVK